VLRKQTAYGNSRAWKINIRNASVQEIFKELGNFPMDSPEMAGVGHPSEFEISQKFQCSDSQVSYKNGLKILRHRTLT
jgi:hypothetical protein